MATSTSESFVFSNNLEAPRKSLPGRLFPFAATLAASAFFARQCRESLQRPVGSASDDPRVPAQMVKASGLGRWAVVDSDRKLPKSLAAGGSPGALAVLAAIPSPEH
jgi:hypothetical protein